MISSLNVIISFAFLAAFNFIFFFATGNEHSSAVWTSYAFLHFAVIAVLVLPFIDAKGKTSYESKLSTLSIAYVYAAIEFVVVLATLIYETRVNKEFSGTAVIIIQVVMAFTFVAFIVPNLMVNKTIEHKQAEHDAQNNFVKSISATLKYVESLETDSTLKSKINAVYCIAHASPIRTSASVMEMEKQIVDVLADLEENVENKNKNKTVELLTKVEKLLNKRNYSLKMVDGFN